MHVQGADEFTPWLCHLDYVMAHAAGYGLTRTRTLAWGCDRCDFPMIAHGTTTSAWRLPRTHLRRIEHDAGREHDGLAAAVMPSSPRALRGGVRHPAAARSTAVGTPPCR